MGSTKMSHTFSEVPFIYKDLLHDRHCQPLPIPFQCDAGMELVWLGASQASPALLQLGNWVKDNSRVEPKARAYLEVKVEKTVCSQSF